MDELEITPAEAKELLTRDENALLVDVREPWEYELCRIEGAKLIPMGSIPANLQALDTDEEVMLLSPWNTQPGCGGMAARARRGAGAFAGRGHRSLVYRCRSWRSALLTESVAN